ncbi:MAG: glycosyltransferase [Gammaproteobacteria bacterium]|nr:MAG: glycosyltransferase [Gammaproteobacteria bacterium]UTW42496.1 glycosyltransferase family 4 protein [bacterium SCSIO 12844]
MILAIDASRNRSGGAIAHLVGILSEDPTKLGIKQVHLWAYERLSNAVADQPWLVKHSPGVLKKSIVHQLYWQKKHLPIEIKNNHCDMVLNTDAGSICPFQPSVTISQDMLSFEPGAMKRYWPSKAWLRLWVLKYVQKKSLKSALGSIFLTQYAADVIQKTTGLINYHVIPHGIDQSFLTVGQNREIKDQKDHIELLYISNAAMYKHQWNVIRAMGKLRKLGFDIKLKLVGGGSGKAQALVDEALKEVDPQGDFISQTPFVEHHQIPDYLKKADIFIFASSCENMPITLMEAMAAKLPVASSNRGPMPEVLSDAGNYFDPEDIDSIVTAVKPLLQDSALREAMALKAFEIVKQFSWRQTSDETFRYLYQCYQASKKRL